MDNRIFLLMGGGGGGTEPVLDTLEVSANGTYTPPAGTDGYDEVIVDVEPTLETKSITVNGTYTPAQGYDGFDEVTVSVTPALETKSITTNGTYTPSTGKDGFSQVTVNVPTGGATFSPDSTKTKCFSIPNAGALKFVIDNLESTSLRFMDFTELFKNADLRNISSVDNITLTSNTSPVVAVSMFRESYFSNYFPTINAIIQNGNYMFGYCYYSDFPRQITINVINLQSWLMNDFSNCFTSCRYMKTFPSFRKHQSSYSDLMIYRINDMFKECYLARDLENVFLTSELTTTINHSSTSAANFIVDCYSLRSLPAWYKHFVKYNEKPYGYYDSSYYCLCKNNYVLDEITNLPVLNTVNFNDNAFYNAFWRCERLSSFTFETNNGTPYTANWKKQTIDLTTNVGSASSESDILNYNSGITIDKKVTSQAEYQSLKNDPDWYTCDINYSRYNHDSAVETINSLPDCSAYTAGSDVNTIKFVGVSGTNTDGGAISNLTAEEIAVATAKGWTVSIS